jgi:hypothetical protein
MALSLELLTMAGKGLMSLVFRCGGFCPVDDSLPCSFPAAF